MLLLILCWRFVHHTAWLLMNSGVACNAYFLCLLLPWSSLSQDGIWLVILSMFLKESQNDSLIHS